VRETVKLSGRRSRLTESFEKSYFFYRAQYVFTQRCVRFRFRASTASKSIVFPVFEMNHFDFVFTRHRLNYPIIQIRCIRYRKYNLNYSLGSCTPIIFRHILLRIVTYILLESRRVVHVSDSFFFYLTCNPWFGSLLSCAFEQRSSIRQVDDNIYFYVQEQYRRPKVS